MNAKEVLAYLKEKGSPTTKNTFIKHGAPESIWGVKVGDMKPLVKKIKKDYNLSKELYQTGHSDAMYFSGLIADESKMTKEDLQAWVEEASWYMISEYTVSWIAAESQHGMELALDWIESNDEKIASSGWATLSSICSIKDNDELNLNLIESLLERAAKEVHAAQNRVRYTMNGFIIAVGCYIPELTKKAETLATKVGKINVEMGGTSCKVPLAKDYIKKVVDAGRVGNKRKMARC